MALAKLVYNTLPFSYVVWLDFFGAIAIALLACIAPKWLADTCARLGAPFRGIAERRWLACLLVFALVVVLRVGILPLRPVPVPAVHDEFSYLLAGDTFAHGRATNVTPEAWRHFQSFHTILLPTYASKYPPGQGIALAAGQWLGHPWIGVLLGCAGAAAAVCWALQGWTSPGWAFVGALVFTIRVASLGYWANSYWGGAVACIGGALVAGAYPRLRDSRRLAPAVGLGLGLSILANTRPYEGVLVAIPFLSACAFRWFRTDFKQALRRQILPLAVTLLVTLGLTGYYYWRVTGNPLRLAYSVYQSRYDRIPVFIWGKLDPAPPYVDSQFAAFDHWETGQYEVMRQDIHGHVLLIVFRLIAFFAGPLLLASLIGLRVSPSLERLRVPVAAFAVCLIGVICETWSSQPGVTHYVAPIVPLFYILLFGTMNETTLDSAPCRRAFCSLLLPSALVVSAVALWIPQEPSKLPAWNTPSIVHSLVRHGTSRAALESSVSNQPGQHLIIVRYAQDSDPHREYVFNGADLSSQRVLWARSLGEKDDIELAKKYPDRKIWIFDARQAVLLPSTLRASR